MLMNLLKQYFKFWKEDVIHQKEKFQILFNQILTKKLLEVKFSDNTKEVVKMITDKTSIKYDKYLRTLSHDGLICPSP